MHYSVEIYTLVPRPEPSLMAFVMEKELLLSESFESDVVDYGAIARFVANCLENYTEDEVHLKVSLSIHGLTVRTIIPRLRPWVFRPQIVIMNRGCIAL